MKIDIVLSPALAGPEPPPAAPRAPGAGGEQVTAGGLLGGVTTDQLDEDDLGFGARPFPYPFDGQHAWHSPSQCRG